MVAVQTYVALQILDLTKQIGFIMYGLHYTLFILCLRLQVEGTKSCSKSILWYFWVLCVSLPIRWKMDDMMYEWPWPMYCFNQKGTSCSHRAEAWKVEIWPVAFEQNENTSSPDLSASLPAMIPLKLKGIQCCCHTQEVISVLFSFFFSSHFFFVYFLLVWNSVRLTSFLLDRIDELIVN